jgi:uncharacterized protein
MEVHTIPVDFSGDTGKLIIYRPLAGLAFVGNRAMASLAIRAASDSWSPEQESPAKQTALDFLERIGYFRPDPQLPAALPTRYSSLVLLLTNRCHLRCTYCYAAAGERSREELSEAHARAAIDYVFDQADANELKEAHLIFHGGGEPVFAWQLLQDATQYARSKPLPATVTLTTNAIWSPQQREWIFANIDSVGVSMDGAPETQDRQRPLSNGGASSPLVMRNLAEIDRRGIQYGIRMTAAAPFDSLPANVEFICKETGTRTLQVEPAFNDIRGQHQRPQDEQWAEFAEAFLEAFTIARAHGRRLYYSGARPGIASTTFCTSPYQALAVAPGGRLVACYEITSDSHPLAPIATFGQIEDGQVRIDLPARDRLHRLLAERRATCRDCFCYWTCAGDCFSRAFQPGAEGHLVKSSRCEMNRTITAQMLLNLIAEGSGYWAAPAGLAPEGGRPLTAIEEELYG